MPSRRVVEGNQAGGIAKHDKKGPVKLELSQRKSRHVLHLMLRSKGQRIKIGGREIRTSWLENGLVGAGTAGETVKVIAHSKEIELCWICQVTT